MKYWVDQSAFLHVFITRLIKKTWRRIEANKNGHLFIQEEVAASILESKHDQRASERYSSETYLDAVQAFFAKASSTGVVAMWFV